VPASLALMVAFQRSDAWTLRRAQRIHVNRGYATFIALSFLSAALVISTWGMVYRLLPRRDVRRPFAGSRPGPSKGYCSHSRFGR